MNQLSNTNSPTTAELEDSQYPFVESAHGADDHLCCARPLPLAVVEYHEIESLINEAFNSASLSSAASFDSQEHDFDFQDDEPLAIEEPANLTGDQTASTPKANLRWSSMTNSVRLSHWCRL